jgi:hypothetical protein
VNREFITAFEVTTAVVHYVPSPREDDPNLVLTDEAIALDGGLDEYFEDKIIERLESKGLEVVRDPEKEPSVAEAVAVIRDDPDQLVAASHRIARHLFANQTKVNSSGLLAVVRGTSDGREALAILKLERERGIRFAIDTIRGRNIVDLELLRNLTLTDKTKVYKTALLRSSSGTQLGGFVADDQRGMARGIRVASFFLGDFLGCMPKVPAAKATYDFVEAVNKTINKDVESPERKGNYSVALLAELQSATVDLKPADFATRHMRKEDRPAFRQRLAEAGLDPDSSFAKDTSLIKVSRFRMTFKSGMVLVGKDEDLDERVDLPDDAASGEPVKLNDTVQNLLSGR